MRPLAITDARLLDAASGYDGPGAIVVRDGLIADVVRGSAPTLSPDFDTIDASGALLIPGLIDVRVKTGEPGAEPKETLKSASRAAAAGGVTTIVLQPDTDPAADSPAAIDFVLRRGRDLNSVNILPAGALTRGCAGERMAEIGLMREAGAAYFSDADHLIRDTRLLRRLMTYAAAFGAVVAHRPGDPWLTAGAVATEGEFASRLGLPSVPAEAERIGLQRDLALAELTCARLLVDQITTAGALDALRSARERGVRATATASINHLTFNELDVGDYRTFYRLDPPLRAEDHRQALIDALGDGTVEIVTSAHTPAPAEDKRLPFAEAAPGAVGLETLLPALLSLHHDGRVPLATLIRAVTLAPADLLGLPAGRLAPGAPADLVLCDLGAPWRVDADRLLSKSKNSPFDGRLLQGRVLQTLVGGRTVYRREG